MRKEDPSAFHALSSKFEKGRFNFEKIVDYHKYFDKMMEYIGPLEEDVILLMDGYRERKVFALVEEFLKLNLRKEEHELLGLIHGDCWINNIMIRGGGESDKGNVLERSEAGRRRSCSVGWYHFQILNNSSGNYQKSFEDLKEPIIF